MAVWEGIGETTIASTKSRQTAAYQTPGIDSFSQQTGHEERNKVAVTRDTESRLWWKERHFVGDNCPLEEVSVTEEQGEENRETELDDVDLFELHAAGLREQVFAQRGHETEAFFDVELRDRVVFCFPQ